MRIVIDLQGAQSFCSRNRGIGRYSLSLARGIARNRGEHELVLALSDAFPESIDSIVEAFRDLVPQENILVWSSPPSVGYINPDSTWRRRAAECLRESFLASLRPDVVLVSSLFEGFDDDSITSVGRLGDKVPTAVVLYDLIPYINREIYLQNPLIASWYDGKIECLRSADLLLAISESSRKEAVRYLGADEQRAVNISTAIDAHFKINTYSQEQVSDLLARYGLQQSFVMYTGGIDHRKNIERLIQAYAQLPASLRERHQLAVVCSVRSEDRARLQKLAEGCGLAKDRFVMTGFVSEEDLVALYNLCQAFIFPSWHEGFGLPALEAMACGRAVIASDKSSLPEVVNYPPALFDPMSVNSIAEKLSAVLSDAEFREELEQHGIRQAKEFSWDRTGQRAIEALEALHAQRLSKTMVTEPAAGKPTLAYVSPLPPERSGISDYSAELLPMLMEHFTVEVVVAQEEVTTSWVRDNVPVRSVEWFEAHAATYDHVLYHFGNSTFHEHMFELIKSIPGVVVLHDFFLSGILAHMELNSRAQAIWLDALYESHGYAAVIDRFHCKELVDVVLKYPANLPVLRQARGVIVHSENSRQLARDWYGPRAALDWVNIPLLRAPVVASTEERQATYARLGLDACDFVVCSFGLLGPSKLNHRLLDAWLNSPMAQEPSCALVFVGQNDPGSYGDQLNQRIEQAGVASRIQITGWASSETFRDYLNAADVGVQLRTHSRGETSAAVLDCMNYGLPTIVNANGSMADLEDDCVIKLPDEFLDGQLVDALTALWRDQDARAALGGRARNLVSTKHAPEQCALQYKSAIERFYAHDASHVVQLIGAIEALDTAPEEDVSDEDLLVLADAIDRSLLPSLANLQILLDVTPYIEGRGGHNEAKAIIARWLAHVPAGIRLEPVFYHHEKQAYCYARTFTLEILGCPSSALHDSQVVAHRGDCLVMLNNQVGPQESIQAVLRSLGCQGVKIQYVSGDECDIELGGLLRGLI